MTRTDAENHPMQIAAPITALVYTDSEAADGALRAVAAHLLERDFRLAGLVQHNHPRPGRSRCDMVLEEMASGELFAISQDRGPHARGCTLDVSQLLQAMQAVRAALRRSPDLVVLNKFGKTESEGRGFRELIGEVIEVGAPLLIAVPWRNIDAWRCFSGGLSIEHRLDGAAFDREALARQLGRGVDFQRSRNGPGRLGA